MTGDGEGNVFLNPPQFSIERMDELEQEVRDLNESRREDLARVAALALLVGEQTEVLHAVKDALDDLRARVNAVGRAQQFTAKRVNLNVECIQKLNNVASTLGEGHQVA